MKMHHDTLDSLIDRVDELDDASRANLISRLARERHLLGTVMNSLREGILVVEASGRLEFANPASQEMLGIHERDVGETILWRAVPDLARTLKMSSKGYLLEEANVSRELELTYPQRRIVRIYLVPFDDSLQDVQLARYVVILSDITKEYARTRQEIEDERVNSILELAAGVAHELGNPLNSLTIHLENCSLSTLFVRIIYESKCCIIFCFSIFDNRGICDFSKLGENVSKILVSETDVNVANEQVGSLHLFSFFF